jgi:hypothetical protein
MHLTENAFDRLPGYSETLGLYVFIPCAQALYGPCDVEDHNNVAKLEKFQLLLKKFTPGRSASNPE